MKSVRKVKKSAFLRSLAVTCAAALLMGTFPLYTMAKTVPGETAADTTEVTDNAVQDTAGDSPSAILMEDKDKRTEDSKEFVMKNGTRMVAMYDTPVHYQDDNGVWQDYDNTVDSNTGLSLTDGITTDYKNKKSDKDIRLTDKAKDKSMVTIKSNGNTLSWGFEGVKHSRVEFTKKDDSAKEGNDKFLALPNLTQEAWYRDVYPNVDMQYLITSTGIKENIVLKNTEAQREFTVNYNIGDLTATQIDDRTIELRNDADEQVYTLTAPVMTDANGETSDNVTLTILKNKGKKLIVQVTADSEWLNDPLRVYPVQVDPYVYVDKTPQTTEYATLVQDTSHQYCSGSLKIGRERTAYQRMQSIIKMDNLPELRPGDMVTSASFNALQVGYSGTSDVQVNVSKNTSYWDKTSVKNNGYSLDSGPSYDTTIEDYAIANDSTGWKAGMTGATMTSWDITKTVKGWYSGEPNYGLRMWPDKPDVYSYVDYTPANSWSSFPETCYPYITISYLNNNGLEDYWSYHSMAAGFNGAAHVNDYTGNLVYTEDIFHSTGSLNPADIQLIYNSSKYNQHFRYGASSGWGFQLNISQRVDYAPESVKANGYKYVYTDADGTERYFRLKDGCTDGTAGAKWVDEDGKGEELTEEDGGIVIRDKAGNEYSFCKPEDSGTLFYIKDSEGNELRTKATKPFAGHDYCITNIYDGAGRETKVNYELCQTSYTNYMRIRSIVDPDNRTFTFYYADSDENALVKIGYPDGTYTSFGYEGIGRLDTIRSSSGKKVSLSYVSSSGICRTRIASMKEQALNTSGNYIDGGSYRFEYGRQVVNSSDYDNSTKITDEKSRSEIFQFDNAGRTTSVLGSDGSVSKTSYTQNAGDNHDGSTASPEATKNNKMQASSGSQKYVRNYLLNPSGERNGDYYYSTWDNSGKTSQSYATDAAFFGSRSMKITHNQSGMTLSSFAQQILTSSFDNANATLSVYVKTQNVQGTNANGGAGLNIICYDSSGNAITSWTSSVRVTGTHDWQRISLTTGVIPSNIAEIRTYFTLQDATGTAWFDCGQLEYGSTMSDCNLLDDCSFCRTDRWSTRNFTGDDTYSGAGYINMKGTANGNKQLYQYLPVNRPGVCFNILGVVSGAFAPDRKDSDRMSAVELEIIYTDGVHEWQRANFNQATTSGQTVYTVVKPKDSGKVISSVGFTFTYRNQVNNCTISNAMMTIDETGTTYSYDSKGNLQGSADNAKRNQTYTYSDANELTKSTNANNESYSYTYDSNNAHRLVSAKSNQRSNGFNYSYDSKGNVTKTTMGSIASGSTTVNTSTDHISSSSSYYNPSKSYNYNYLYSSTDARGKTSTYDVNTVNGLTKTQTVPMTIRGVDTKQTTSYSYNEGTNGNYLLRGVSSTDNGRTMSASYSYYSGSNLLQTITHNGFSYLFHYDPFGKALNTMIGSRTLSSNDYNANNGTLKKTTYGNGNYNSYNYDAFNRVTQISTEQGTLAQYTYNNEGQLARIADVASGTTADYTYDLSGRLVQSDKTGGLFKQQQQYTYDNMNRVTSQTNWLGNDAFAYGYTYGKDSLLTQSAQGGVIFNYNYDNLNRVNNVTANYNGNTFKQAYSYLPGSESRSTTSLVSTAWYFINSSPIHQIDYTYDDSGNIQTVDDNGGQYKIHYYYDGFNQLVREDNASLYYTKTYEYDAGGNLTAVNRYPYTTNAINSIPLKTIRYGYGDSSWRDLMTSYDGQTITYDAIGNPLKYRDNMSMKWNQGRQLTTLQLGLNTISYTYGEDGLRTKKLVNGLDSNYIRDDSGRLICYKTSIGTGHAMWFYYNPGSTTPDSIVFDGNRYVYFKNVQGDILGIVDKDGNLVAAYDYDSWGKCVHVYDGHLNVNTDYNFIGNINPLRYRGYEYDAESGLYYLQSRYYDPTTGRFVNADGIVGANSDIKSANLFAYCGNNPVNNIDPKGTMYGPYTDQQIIDFMNAGGNGNYTADDLERDLGDDPLWISDKDFYNLQVYTNPSQASWGIGIVGDGMSLHRGVIGAVGCIADLSQSASVGLCAYGYATSLPFAIWSHQIDPGLTQTQRNWLSVMEVGLAVGGLAIAFFGTAGVGLLVASAAYTVGSIVVSHLATQGCYNVNKSGSIFGG